MIDTTLPNLYDRLTELDFNGKAGNFLQMKGFHQRSDGRWTRNYAQSMETPWVHQFRHLSHSIQPNCEMWHQLFFEHTKWTPTECAKNCWKVVVVIPTLKNLFEVYELQKTMNHPCKCGLEHRPTDERRYGAYFYNNTKEEALDCLDKVRKEFHTNIRKDLNIFMKCACSEYEIKNGPPEDYIATPQQLQLENLYKRYVVVNDIHFDQKPHQVAAIMLRWIHHAMHIGDMTYKRTTGGRSMAPKMKTYERE